MSRIRLHLTFPEHLVDQPVIHETAKRFGVVPSIRRANVEARTGWVILEISGDVETLDAAVAHLEEVGVVVNRMEGDVVEG